MILPLLLASLLSAPVCNPSQLSYTASGGVKRAVCDKLSDVVSVKGEHLIIGGDIMNPMDTCSDCKAAPMENRRYCERHLRARRDYSKQWRDAHPEKSRAKTKKWHAANSEHKRDYAFRRNYGITALQVDALLLAQGGRCAICNTDRPDTRMRWHVDHDHLTGRVRGILCHKCNMGIGALRDDPAILRAAVAYLERGQC